MKELPRDVEKLQTLVDRFVRAKPGGWFSRGNRADCRDAHHVFHPEFPAKLNHAEFRGNNLLFDFERPVDLLRTWDLCASS